MGLWEPEDSQRTPRPALGSDVESQALGLEFLGNFPRQGEVSALSPPTSKLPGAEPSISPETNEP